VTLGSLLFCHLAQFSLSMRKEGTWKKLRELRCGAAAAAFPQRPRLHQTEQYRGLCPNPSFETVRRHVRSNKFEATSCAIGWTWRSAETNRSHVNCVALLLLLRFQRDRDSIKLSDIADFVSIHPLKQRDAPYAPTISKRHPAQLGGNGDQLRLIELLESLMAGVWTSDYKYAELMRNHFVCILRSCLHCGICTQQNLAVYSILISRRCVEICSSLSIEVAESAVDPAFTNVADTCSS
jgi:hypothetical protein